MVYNMDEEIAKMEIKKEMACSTNYIKWLIDFMEKEEWIFDDEALLPLSNITDDDAKNITNLDLFFDVIIKYAESKKIEAFFTKFVEFFNVKFNDKGFEIGAIMGQETTIYCRRKPIDDSFIDFNDVISNKKKNDMLLNPFSENIQNMYNKGVPLNDIIDTFNDTVQEIRQKNRCITLKREKK